MTVSKLIRAQQHGWIGGKWDWQRPSLSWFTLALALGGGVVALLILVVPTYLLSRMVVDAEVAATLLQVRTWQVMGNTIGLAAAVTGATAVIAIPLAWLTACTDLPGKRLWAVLAALPLVIPSYVAAYLYASILSPKGLLQQGLFPLTGIERLPNFYGFPGAFFVLTLITYPYTFLTVRAALKRLDPSLVEAARSLGYSPWQAFWRVTLPTLRPSIVAGSLLVALYSLRDFGAVTMLQYSTFTRIIYNRYQGYRLDTAATLALLLVLLTAVILYLEYRSRSRGQYARLSAGAARQAQPVPLGRWQGVALLYVGGVLALALVTPTAGLLYWFGRGWRQDWLVRDLGGAQSNVHSLLNLASPALNSLTASALGALLTVALALPVAILVTRYPGKLSRTLEQITYAAFALPGVVVALAAVYVGITTAASLYQTMPMLLGAYVILFIPQAISAQRASFLQLPRSLEEAGRSLGQRPFTIFQRITFPLVKSGVTAGALLVFLTCMKELPATLILSPLGFNTLAATVWTHINEAFFARAAAPTLLLLLLSSLPLAWLTLREKG